MSKLVIEMGKGSQEYDVCLQGGHTVVFGVDNVVWTTERDKRVPFPPSATVVLEIQAGELPRVVHEGGYKVFLWGPRLFAIAHFRVDLVEERTHVSAQS